MSSLFKTCSFLFRWQALNELSEEQGFPVEFLDGSIAQVSVTVPWSALLSDSIFVEIKGLVLVVNPRQQCRNCEWLWWLALSLYTY